MDNMEVMLSSSCPVSKASLRIVFLFAWVVSAHLLHGQSIVGVVYSNTIGNGRHAAGSVDLGVDGKVVKLNYAAPLDQHFSGVVCNEIGAIWTVDVQRFDNSLYIKSVSCAGQFDKDIHESWALVRDYLSGLPRSVSRSVALSARYRSSREFALFREQVNSHELNFYFGSDEVSRCLRVTEAARSRAISIAVNCPIELRSKLVGLLFELGLDRASGNWEIDAIKIN